MSATDLRAALAAVGIDCAVEERGRIAVLSSATVSSLLSRRREIVTLARRHGFTNVCGTVEADAPLSGD